jgi:hypothetical protein
MTLEQSLDFTQELLDFHHLGLGVGWQKIHLHLILILIFK